MHYRVSADYEHGCHFTALPTPWIAGYQPKMDDAGNVTEKLYIGGEAAWVFPNPEAKAQYLEFTGQGLDAVSANLDRKERIMAVLGARMLMDDTKGVETLGAHQIKRTGENSVLATISQTLSIAWTRTLRRFVKWAGAEKDTLEVKLNKDFLPVQMDAPTLSALMAAFIQGGITEPELFDLLKRSDVIDGKKTMDQHQAEKDEFAPPAPAAPKAPTDVVPGNEGKDEE
jgi:hypothetical protein